MKEFFKKHSATMLSILATIVVGYVGLTWGQSQFRKAEEERKDRVRESIVKIIEENAINDKVISPSRLDRLTEIKCQNEGISSVFNTYDLLKEAEYNLIESRHIDFNKKEEYKLLFDSIYKTYIPNAFLQLKNDSIMIYAKNSHIIDNLVKNINGCKTTEAIEDLGSLISIYEMEIESYKSKHEKKYSDSFENFIRTPFGITVLVIFMCIYIFIMFPLLRRMLRRTMTIKNSRSA